MNSKETISKEHELISYFYYKYFFVFTILLNKYINKNLQCVIRFEENTIYARIKAFQNFWISLCCRIHSIYCIAVYANPIKMLSIAVIAFASTVVRIKLYFSLFHIRKSNYKHIIYKHKVVKHV